MASTWTVGPVGPTTPCDSSRTGRSWMTSPDQEAGAGQILIKTLASAILEQEVFGTVGPDQNLEALLR